jgi:hypothetical protein
MAASSRTLPHTNTLPAGSRTSEHGRALGERNPMRDVYSHLISGFFSSELAVLFWNVMERRWGIFSLRFSSTSS